MQECVVCKRVFEYSGEDLELGTCSPECTFQYTHIINHKGTFCRWAKTFCQEGFCSDCMIYRNYEAAKKGSVPGESGSIAVVDRQKLCPVCREKYLAKNLPTCQDCFNFFIHFINHKDLPCWISLEVSPCQVGYCSGCKVFKIEQEIKRED